MNDRLDGLSSGVNLDASRGLRMSDLLVDRNLDASSDGNLYRRTNELQDDLNLDVKMDVSRGHHMSDRLDDQNLDDVRHGLTMGDDLMTDVNLCHRMNDRLDDRKMVATKDVNHRDVLVGHCNYARHDRNLDVSHANRNCVRRDRSLGVMMDGNLCRRMNDLLVDLMTDGNRGHHMSDLLVDRNLVLKMDAMSLHAK
jgi:hypothetical protein